MGVKRRPTLIAVSLLVAGALLVTIGLFAVWPPLAPIFAGLALGAFGLLGVEVSA